METLGATNPSDASFVRVIFVIGEPAPLVRYGHVGFLKALGPTKRALGLFTRDASQLLLRSKPCVVNQTMHLVIASLVDPVFGSRRTRTERYIESLSRARDDRICSSLSNAPCWSFEASEFFVARDKSRVSGKPTFNGAPVLRDNHAFRMAPKVAGVRLVLHLEVCLGRVQWFEIQIGPV